MSPDAVVQAFFHRWQVSFEEMCSSFGSALRPDCVWDQRPLARTVGPDEAVRFLRRCRILLGLSTIEVEVRSLAVADDVVHTARVDHLRRADGSVIASAPVAGVLTVEGGEIVHWREYFDATGLAAQTVATGAGSAARSLGRRLSRRR